MGARRHARATWRRLRRLEAGRQRAGMQSRCWSRCAPLRDWSRHVLLLIYHLPSGLSCAVHTEHSGKDIDRAREGSPCFAGKGIAYGVVCRRTSAAEGHSFFRVPQSWRMPGEVHVGPVLIS